MHLAEEKKREKIAKQKEPTSASVSSSYTGEAEVDGQSSVYVLNDNVMLEIFSYLSIRDRIMVERGKDNWFLCMMSILFFGEDYLV